MPREPRQDLIPIGQRIRSARVNMGLSQEQLRMKLAMRGVDITQSGYSHWELGRAEISITDLRVLADILRVNAGFLLGQSDAELMLEDPHIRRYYGLEQHQKNLIDALVREMASSDREEARYERKAG